MTISRILIGTVWDFAEQNAVYVIGKRNMVRLSLSCCPRYPQEKAGKEKRKKSSLLTMVVLITQIKITRQMKTKKHITSNQNFELQTLRVRAARDKLKYCPLLLFINLFYTRNESMTVPALALYDKAKCI